MRKKIKFKKSPFVAIKHQGNVAWENWDAIISKLQGRIKQNKGKTILAVECYPGVFEDDIQQALQNGLSPTFSLNTASIFKPEDAIRQMVHPDLTDDEIFGIISHLQITNYFDPGKLAIAQKNIKRLKKGLVLLIGPGASQVVDSDILVYADMARWEIQQRMRANEASNLGVQNMGDPISKKYKWGYFIDWRVCDRLKKKLIHHWDFVLDTNNRNRPKLVSGDAYRNALTQCVERPIMLVPFFDPGVWGGQWMKKKFKLDTAKPNYAWCFNCVPEENSLLLKFNLITIESPAINLVFYQSRQLLGEKVYSRFGAEFPIRFDFLDTMGGENLSLQVHPNTEYIQDNFGMNYTQDESYYILDASDNAVVYLGLKEGATKEDLQQALELAQEGEHDFPAKEYVNTFKVKKHDHYLIPAGTIHCSGKNTMVLEISATPYIFTFKLWDWNRLGMDGKPRPINIDRGMEVIEMNRSTNWVKKNLANRIEEIASGDGWQEERTGLHQLEFIETRRYRFRKINYHNTLDNVHVLNLVAGQQVLVASPTGDFPPFVVSYAETFIVPAQVGPYTIRPHGPSKGKECTILKAFVRT